MPTQATQTQIPTQHSSGSPRRPEDAPHGAGWHWNTGRAPETTYLPLTQVLESRGFPMTQAERGELFTLGWLEREDQVCDAEITRILRELRAALTSLAARGGDAHLRPLHEVLGRYKEAEQVDKTG